MMAGGLGKELAKFPLLFAQAVIFGQRPSKTRPREINNGTISFVDLGHGPIGITCHHVITDYRVKCDALADFAFQIGNIEIDPIKQLIDQNEQMDLATIHLSANQIKAITSQGEIGSCVFRPTTWPSPRLKDGEFVAFGGFPGSLRKLRSFDELEFPSWSSGASRISSVSDFKFISAFEREFWVSSFGAKHQVDLRALGGMSGGPAFIKRELHWDFVGIVSDYHENYDAVIFASVRTVRSDGTIDRPPV